MTINVSQNGSTRVISDDQAVRDAIRQAAGDQADDVLDVLSEDFIPMALNDGLSIERIVAIALGKEASLPRHARIVVPHCLYCGTTSGLTTTVSPSKDLTHIWCPDCHRPSFLTVSHDD